MTIEFLITSLIVIASPGTGALYTLAAGFSRGSRASVVAAFGCTLGIVPHMAAAILGLAALLHTSAMAFQVFKYLGVAYLLYMAWHTLQEHGALKVDDKVDARSALQVTVTAILINILNPKLSIFFLAFLPQFVDTSRGGVWFQVVVLGLLFIALGLISDSLYALAGGYIGGLLRRRRTAMRYASGTIYIGLGTVAALAKR